MRGQILFPKKHLKTLPNNIFLLTLKFLFLILYKNQAYYNALSSN